MCTTIHQTKRVPLNVESPPTLWLNADLVNLSGIKRGSAVQKFPFFGTLTRQDTLKPSRLTR